MPPHRTSSMSSLDMQYFSLSDESSAYTDSTRSSPVPQLQNVLDRAYPFRESRSYHSLLLSNASYQHLHDKDLRKVLKLGTLPLDLSALPIRYPKRRLKAERNGTLARYPIVPLIALAIRGSPRQALRLSEIYEAVETQLPEYTPDFKKRQDLEAQRKWRQSVRHSLSLQSMFQLMGSLDEESHRKKRRGDEWTLNPFVFGITRRSVTPEKVNAAIAAMTAAEVEARRMEASPAITSIPMSTYEPSRPDYSASRYKVGRRQKDHASPPPAYYRNSAQDLTGLIDPRLYGLADFPPPIDSASAFPRDLMAVAPIGIPSLPPMASLLFNSSHALPSYSDPYIRYPHAYYPRSDISSPMLVDKSYDADQGISPSLLHAPVPVPSSREPHAEPSMKLPPSASPLRRSARGRRNALVLVS